MGCWVSIQDHSAPGLADNDVVTNDDCSVRLISIVNRRLTHLEGAIYECLVAGVGRLRDWLGTSRDGLAKDGVTQPDGQSAKPRRGQKTTPLNDRRSPKIRLHFFRFFHSTRILDRFRVERKRLAEAEAQVQEERDRTEQDIRKDWTRMVIRFARPSRSRSALGTLPRSDRHGDGGQLWAASNERSEVGAMVGVAVANGS